MASKHYEYFVIGAGSGGVRSARIAASHGAKVGIAEAGKLGGTCVNVGCVPKKLMVYGSDYGYDLEDSKGYGWSHEGVSFDWKTLIKNKNERIEIINGFFKKLLKDHGVHLHRGYARFIDDHTLDIDGETVTADRILIATGGHPNVPPFEGGDHTIVSDDFFYLPEQPKNVVVLGGGYIAVEFAHILHGLGSDITLIHRGDNVLRSFDDDLRDTLKENMEKQGYTLQMEKNVIKVEKHGSNDFMVHTDCGLQIECNAVVSALGRSPNTGNIGLDKAGVKTNDKGYIPVNKNFETNVPHIHAVGDISSPYHLTPVAIKEGHILADRLFGGRKDCTISYDNVATVIFSKPNIGTIGLSEKDALKRGHDIKIFKSSSIALKHKMAGRDEKSLFKLVVDQETDRILGMHVIGMGADEMVQGFSVAMNLGATKADFDRTIAVHPTMAEEFVTMR